MKVIAQQTVCKRLSNRLDVSRIEPQEIDIIAIFVEDILAIIATTINMVKRSILKWLWAGHGRLQEQTLKVFKTFRV
jgi:hypothetical protein